MGNNHGRVGAAGRGTGTRRSAATQTPSLNRRFEVQIHTGLQYAWWRATHDTVFKGGSRDWRTVRADSQARASLELLDAVLADLHDAGRLQPARSTTTRPRGLVSAILTALLPLDERQRA